MEDKRGYLICDICKENPATELKGGLYEDERKLWIICKKCKPKIINMRLTGGNND